MFEYWEASEHAYQFLSGSLLRNFVQSRAYFIHFNRYEIKSSVVNVWDVPFSQI